MTNLKNFAQRLSNHSRQIFWIITFISGLLAIGLLFATWNIQFWPTDAEVYYLPAARELPSLQHLSQIHDSLDEERIKWLHGKEIHVLAISLFQRLLNDTETLRPLMMVGVLSVFLSAVLVFLIARVLWGSLIGLLIWFLFSTSFWPYLYILFAKHQTQGLALFLCSALLLLMPAQRWAIPLMIMAGASFGASLYSSTVSALYGPYVLAAFGYAVSCKEKRAWIREALVGGIFFGLGLAVIVVWVNYPNIAYNLKSYVEYIRISSAFNHFYYNQPFLVQWIPSFDLKDTRGGWSWILRYFLLVMPVVFPLYLAAAGYWLAQGWRTTRWILPLGVIALSFSSPILAEIKGVAQYGANYFTVFVGILFLLGFTLSQWLKRGRLNSKNAQYALVGVLAVHAVVNLWIFGTDVYPARMVTTRLSEAIEGLDVRHLATYRQHPLRRNLIDHLKPDVLKNISWTPIGSLAEINQGYVIVPPVSTDSIYLASTSDYTDFDLDPVLNNLMQSGRIDDYAVKGLPTLSSSRIWAQEEEILAYRTLVLGQFPPANKTKVWILDAAALSRDLARYWPSKEQLKLMAEHVENIGPKTPVNIYKGQRLDLKGGPLTKIATRIYKVGDPQDNLVAYVFKVEEHQPLWIPESPQFASLPVQAAQMTANPQGGLVTFEFTQPLDLASGPHLLVIYRTGRSNDNGFYRIYKDFVGRLQ